MECCSKHVVLHPTHEFTWSVVSSAPQSSKKRKILEAFYMVVWLRKVGMAEKRWYC